MQLQAYKGYFENGNFYTAGKSIRIPERRQITLILEEQSIQNDDTLDEQLAAMDKFIKAMSASDEEVPIFERIKLREVEV